MSEKQGQCQGQGQGQHSENAKKKNTKADTHVESTEPTNRDLMNCLQEINGRINIVEKKLEVIDHLKKKLGNFESELKNLWITLEDRNKQVEQRVMRVEDRIDESDISSAMMTSRLAQLEKENENLKDDLVYLKSQSMRNNLVFVGITEESTIEGPDQTESKLRNHLANVMKLSDEFAKTVKFERVHRSPSERKQGRNRSIIAKFTYFKDRETVQRQWKELQGTPYKVFEQFPPQVVNKRKKLVAKMKEARKQGSRSWIVYDTLYVDGKAIRE